MVKKIPEKCHKGHSQKDNGYIRPNGEYHGCRICKNERTNEWYKRKYIENPDWQINKHLKQNWGLTLEQYDEILESQDNRCAICNTDDFGKKRGAVDHDHETGKIRGILCSNCNTGLGLFKDDIHNLKQAIKYLEKHK